MNIKNYLQILLLLILAFQFVCCRNKQQIDGGLKEEACAISKQVVKQKVADKRIRFKACDEKDVLYFGNNRYEVNSFIELPKPSGKLLDYGFTVILKFKAGDADKMENWEIEKLHIDVFWE